MARALARHRDLQALAMELGAFGRVGNLPNVGRPASVEKPLASLEIIGGYRDRHLDTKATTEVAADRSRSLDSKVGGSGLDRPYIDRLGARIRWLLGRFHDWRPA